MTPADFRNARKALGLSQSAMAEALRLSPKNGDRTIRLWETDGNTVPGPAQVAVEYMMVAVNSRNSPEVPNGKKRKG